MLYHFLFDFCVQALGLQSWKAAEKAKTQTKGREKPSTSKGDNYTGTLKTVIKINRDNKKKGKNSLKMTLQKNKGKSSNGDNKNDDHRYKIMKEVENFLCSFRSG